MMEQQIVTVAPSEEERTWAVVAHLSGLVSAFILPIVILLVKGKESRFVRAQTVEALNFHLTMFIGYVVSVGLMFFFVGICTALIVAAMSVICAVIAAVKAWNGEPYHYPLTIRLIR